jgi:acyl-CoA thioester hydrolase
MTQSADPIHPIRPAPLPRSYYRQFQTTSTRWADNDVYGHVNNVVYYSWFDTAVNGYLIAQGALDIHHGAVIGLVVETQCHYFSPIAFPQNVTAGIRVAHIGNSSVSYEVGLFADNQDLSNAHGRFVHVYVDKATRRPVQLRAQSPVSAIGHLFTTLETLR